MRDNHSYLLVINRYPTFMSDIFNDHTPIVNGIDGSGSYIYNINAKMTPHSCGTNV